MILTLELSSGGEPSKEIDSPIAAFHLALHDSDELYLVCYTKVDKLPWQKSWEQIRISATITEVLRGNKKVGDKVHFRRTLDGKYGDISNLHGSLNFIRFVKTVSNVSVDPQDPQSVFQYTEELHQFARKHINVEQDAVANY